MRIFRLTAATLFIAAMAAVPAFAQRTGATTQPAAPAQSGAAANIPAPKIAVVNSRMFGAEKGGITRFVAAYNSLNREFNPRRTELQSLEAKIKAVADEITKTQSVEPPEATRRRQEEGQRLERELKFKQEEAEAAYQKRYEEVVMPISRDIGNAVIAFAKQRGITMVFDMAKIADGVLHVDITTDITAAFIADYNSKNPATASTAAPGR